MKQAVQVTTMNAELITVHPDGSASAKIWPDLPPVDWIVLGPRGGRYRAIGERRRIVMQMSNDWARNTWSVVDRSEGLRYIRPSSG